MGGLYLFFCRLSWEKIFSGLVGWWDEGYGRNGMEWNGLGWDRMELNWTNSGGWEGEGFFHGWVNADAFGSMDWIGLDHWMDFGIGWRVIIYWNSWNLKFDV